MRSLLPLVVLVGCVSQGGKDVPPVKAGSGVAVDQGSQTVSVDSTQVPLVPVCGAGQYVRRTAAGSWECALPDWNTLQSKPDRFPPSAHTHVSADVSDFASGAAAAMGVQANSNPMNHPRYTDLEAAAAMGAKGNTNPMNHDRYTDTEAGAAAVAAMGPKANSNPMNHDRYSDAEAMAAMGAKANSNPMNHDRYSDAEAVAALGKISGNIGIGTSVPGAKLDVEGNVKIADGTQGAGKVLTSDATGLASWQATPIEIPSGAVMYFNLPSCPPGWTDLAAAHGRYLVGVTDGGVVAAEVGTQLNDQENRAAGQHTHGITDPGHVHPYINNGYVQAYCGTSYCQTEYGTNQLTGVAQQLNGNPGTGITVNAYGTVAGTNAPYVQLLVCEKN